MCVLRVCVFAQLKGSQEPKAKKSRRSQMVEPKEEASVSRTVFEFVSSRHWSFQLHDSSATS